MTSCSSALSRFVPPQGLTPSSIVVGNGSLLPVTGTGTRMLTGLVVPTRASPPRAMLCFSGITSSPGPPSARILSPDQALKRSIGLWLMLLPRCHGCASFFMSFMCRFDDLSLSTVTTSALSTCLPTQFNISTPST
ncbi:hypothetical protein PVAP13_3KG486182 [Panicum virgatum]|uniref:Uncharacterized protein n=1 Tax=Panicum virgatum TaxID=38727 RepID=A0A8T0V0V6_PANVG|nr:hypothetical protein PVAP13_3KG486182 [Panicum virgatum]